MHLKQPLSGCFYSFFFDAKENGDEKIIFFFFFSFLSLGPYEAGEVRAGKFLSLNCTTDCIKNGRPNNFHAYVRIGRIGQT